jgi:hypothetical protein|tara:strand:+ start:808 stop:996 length:189 start_codon:yes stop_codon:yes gene_type:complete
LIDLALQFEQDESEIINSFVKQNKEKLLSFRKYWVSQIPTIETEDKFQDKVVQSISNILTNI